MGVLSRSPVLAPEIIMRRLTALLLVLAIGTLVTAQEKAPPKTDKATPVVKKDEKKKGIRLPTFIEPTDPPLTPPTSAPKVLPKVVQDLGPDQWYVVDSDDEVLVLTSPSGLVRTTLDTGPMTLKGKFVDGNGKTEVRKFEGKFIYTLEAIGTGKVEIMVVPKGWTKETDVIRRVLNVTDGTAPIPPPKPKPDDTKPDVKPDPTVPIPGVTGLHVLVVYETGDLSKMPAGQQSILYAKVVRDYLNATCPAGPDGKTKQWRMWDQNVDLTGEQKLWQDTLARPRTSVPWVIISNGKTGFEGPLPKTVDETMALLKKYGS